MIAWLSNRTHKQLLHFGVIVLFIAIILLKAAAVTPVVFFLVLLASFLMTVRLRFKLNPSTAWIDVLVFIGIGFYDVDMIWFTLPLVLYLLSYGHYVSLLSIIGVLFHHQAIDVVWITLFLFAFLLGVILYVQNHKNAQLLSENDSLRKKNFDLEKIQNQLIQDVAETEALSAIKERQKIAEKLHDDLGHELTGAHLALKAFVHIRNQDSTKAETFLTQVNARLDQSLTRLKDTVQNIESMQLTGIEMFKSKLDAFPELPFHFVSHGPIDDIPTYVWQLLYTTLKECITNIIKHANPSYVDVLIEVTEYIVRFKIENDGAKTEFSRTGHGLKYMRKRYQAMHGSLSIQTNNPFTLIAILPLRRHP